MEVPDYVLRMNADAILGAQSEMPKDLGSCFAAMNRAVQTMEKGMGGFLQTIAMPAAQQRGDVSE